MKKITSVFLSLLLAAAFAATGIFAAPVLNLPAASAYAASQEEEDELLLDDLEESLTEEELSLEEELDSDPEIYEPEDALEDALDESLEEPADAAILEDGGQDSAAGYAQTYTLNATLVDGQPGVYEVKAVKGAGLSTDTIGIPSVAKQNLESGPTTEAPAIIIGAANGYETKTGPTEYTPIDGAVLRPPYSYFRYQIVDEKAADGTTHKKMTGFDGTYFIIRIDVSDIIEGAAENQFLHVKQESNSALMVAYGLEGSTFADALGNKTGAYSLANDAAALKDPEGVIPYFDVVVMSSGKLVAGADAGSSTAPSADIKLQFYIDGTENYDPTLPVFDAATMPTFPYKAPNGTTYKTETDYKAALLKKFFIDENATAENGLTGYLIKGSDLEIDVTVDDHEVAGDTPEYWSLTKAVAYQPYDSHTIKLICEVPVLEGLTVKSTNGQKRSVILDVNSFDIQIANNTKTGAAGLTVSDNGELTIKDGTSTSGAELAIGNNAQMVIGNGGTMIVDSSCQLEVEYDAATTPSGQDQPKLRTGDIMIEKGGLLINNGVVNVEGTEGKPLTPAPASGETIIIDKQKAALHIEAGGEMLNYGALSIKGAVFVHGTLTNYGKYDDIINAGDPDKGIVPYHKGIQVTWKDDVTQEGVEPGQLTVGDGTILEIDKGAVFNNYGDVVLAPGTLYIYGTLNNVADPKDASAKAGNLYICTVDEAVIPIEPDPKNPTVVEKRVKIDPPKGSEYVIGKNGKVNNKGFFGEAEVEVTGNGQLGKLTPTHAIIEVTLSAKTFTYNGKAHKPAVTVKAFGKTLKAGTDYTVRYEKNVKAGTAFVIVTGKGNYKGTTKVTFKIKPKSLSKAKATLKYTKLTYNGKARKPAATVKDGSVTLKKNRDYTVKYTKNKNVGKATVTITGKGNYTGTIKKTFKIYPKKTSMVSVTAGSKSFTAKWKKVKAQTSGYQLQYSSSKSFSKGKTVKVGKNTVVKKKVAKLKSKKVYYVRVRTYKTVGGRRYFSGWSKAMKVKTK